MKTATNNGSNRLIGLFIDIKNLLKGKVLIANVFPVFTAFWLAIYFEGEQFGDYIGLFSLTLIGSTLVISGALMLNNWFEWIWIKIWTVHRNGRPSRGTFL